MLYVQLHFVFFCLEAVDESIISLSHRSLKHFNINYKRDLKSSKNSTLRKMSLIFLWLMMLQLSICWGDPSVRVGEFF